MIRVEFKLSMPGNNSWNGRWSGEEKSYTIVRSLPNKRAEELLDDKRRGYWSYSFGDGWVAGVSARVLAKGERAKKSDGFCGYDWIGQQHPDAREDRPVSGLAFTLVLGIGLVAGWVMGVCYGIDCERGRR